MYAPSANCHEGDVKPIFSPHNSEELFNLVKNAKNEIKLEVYEFSYRALADALGDARERGVSVIIYSKDVSKEFEGIFDSDFS